LLDSLACAVSINGSKPDLHALLVGDGPERAALEKQVQSLGLEARVTFAGSHADIRPFLEAADLFVLPSEAEGISNALLEAMSAGITCLATPVGGSSEVLDRGQCGVLLPLNDPFAWGQAFVELGNDLQRRELLGAAARQRILSHYDFSVVGAQYETLYQQMSAAH
jgi:glycosyltransferase involved in cell wall biosynthesis